MSGKKLVEGTSSNGVPYVKWGSGKKTMLVFSGGPGNMLPRGNGSTMMIKHFDPFLDEYEIHMLARKTGLTKGYSTKDMADDYAQMIENDLNGHVDVVIGESYGGIIAHHFAADHEDLFDKIVFAVTSNKFSEKGRAIDYRFAELLSQGKNRLAAVKIAEALAPPGLSLILLKALFWLIGGSMVDSRSSSFKSDIMIEVEAELSHNAEEKLRTIKVPVLIINGDSDIYIPKALAEETAALVPNSIFRLYEGKGHLGVLEDKRFIEDIQDYVDS
ncbi:MAG: alpha/beta hydrolase [Proteobacteria bacterium]|nr:alpha/beta hydrolase [Pseudomonadota bacterium]